MVGQIPNIYYNSLGFPKFSGLIMAPRHHAPRKSWPKLGFPRRRRRLRGLDLAQVATAGPRTDLWDMDSNLQTNRTVKSQQNSGVCGV